VASRRRLLNADVCVYSDQPAALGETRAGLRYALNLGGKGANQAIAAHRLGAQVRFFANTGADQFGDFVRKALTDFGLSLGDVGIVESVPTGLASIAVDAAGRNAITIIAGANATARESEFTALGEALTSASVLLLQCERAASDNLRAARLAKSCGARVVLDPAPAPSDGSLAVLAGLIDYVTPNETETEILTGIRPHDLPAMAAATDRLCDMGFGVAVLKLGARGAYVGGSNAGQLVPVPGVDVVDTVAAGDCFNAAFAVGLAGGDSLVTALRRACAAGALSVTRFGAAASAPNAAELSAFMASSKA
jgi:ribokinase